MKFAITALALALAAPLAQAQATQGVTRNEIVIGTIQDLSGPLAAFGRQARQGMQLRVDEVNEQGGIHGRRLRLVVEDSGYDPRRAVLAAQKLVNQDRIFAMVGHIGTAQNLAAMPVQFERNVLNFLPITASRRMFEPHHRLKYAFVATNFDQMRVAAPLLFRQRNATRACIIYQDDEFGLEVMQGAEAGLQTIGATLVERTTFRRGATDFSSQVARMRAANCDFVVLGTIIRETIGTIAESRRTGFNPTFLGTNATYTDLIHRLGGGRAMDGLVATMTAVHPYLDDASPQVRFWANKYRTKFGTDPTVFSVYGYSAIDAFIRGASAAGPNLTTDSFIRAMDRMVIPPDIFGSPEMRFTATQRQGSSAMRLSEIREGRWHVISDFIDTR
jgi:branched-chain amino acid transport system substrate-binding protein